VIPHKLTLHGFLSYRDMVVVDLSKINVACVSGVNGAGKSTLFDAITWSLFGKARRSDDALINNGMDSCQVVFEFIYENVTNIGKNSTKLLWFSKRGKEIGSS